MVRVLIIFSVLMICVLLIAGASAYYCVEQDDSKPVASFKRTINTMALQHDIQKNNMTLGQVQTKLKYFNNCN